MNGIKAGLKAQCISAEAYWSATSRSLYLTTTRRLFSTVAADTVQPSQAAVNAQKMGYGKFFRAGGIRGWREKQLPEDK